MLHHGLCFTILTMNNDQTILRFISINNLCFSCIHFAVSKWYTESTYHVLPYLSKLKFKIKEERKEKKERGALCVNTATNYSLKFCFRPLPIQWLRILFFYSVNDPWLLYKLPHMSKKIIFLSIIAYNLCLYSH